MFVNRKMALLCAFLHLPFFADGNRDGNRVGTGWEQTWEQAPCFWKKTAMGTAAPLPDDRLFP